MVGWPLLADLIAIKRAGVPILRSLNIRYRLKQQARERGIYDLRFKIADFRLDFRVADLTKRSDCVLSLSYQSSIISRQSKIIRVGL